MQKIIPIFLSLGLILLFSSEGLAEDNNDVALRGEVHYGHASWYGRKFHGKKTSNGERFNKNDLTAAHNFLPFNTKVKVTNLKNKKSVVVRINDRGPFKNQRIIDLSERAAEEINAKNDGIVYVKLQVMGKAQISSTEDKKFISLSD